MPSELLRSLSHAGGSVAGAYRPDGTLVGAAVAVLSVPGEAYSLIAAVRPGGSDRGLGFALKQHQRAWALGRGLHTLRWTFDPLVARNARFNLSKLGAHATEYVDDFYGVMDDEINRDDRSDRLVARWPLTDERVVACSERRVADLGGPAFAETDVREHGPDGEPLLVDVGGSLWCRVPADIVVTRRDQPTTAATWRHSVRRVMTRAFASGLVATEMTRTGWYRFITASDVPAGRTP